MTPTSRTTPTSRMQHGSWGSAANGEFYRGKSRPACPRTVLGLAQQHIALMCGPGPGAPVVYKSRGSPFDPFTCARAVRATHNRPHLARQGRRTMVEPKDKISKATPRPRHREQRDEAGSLGKVLAGAASAAPARPFPGQPAPTPTERATLEPAGSNPTNCGWTRAREAPLWWHADLRQDHRYMRSR